MSVDHPDVVENYRAAHAISQASADQRASTEDLRQAMVHYRALFDELLADGTDGQRNTKDVKEVSDGRTGTEHTRSRRRHPQQPRSRTTPRGRPVRDARRGGHERRRRGGPTREARRP